MLWVSSVMCIAKNTVITVAQVTNPVSVAAAVDYTVTSAIPFAVGGVVNITNTGQAVVVLASVKPTEAITLLPDHVQISGEKAVNGVNCQVKLYNRGSIILPYGNATKPLTVYSGQNFTGTAVSDFGLESSSGYMNTLTEAKLNNQIRSFKLRRGYMVTFALRARGYGYSRCFIAADADLEVATLPAILDQKISSYRIFKWYDTGKPQLAASDGDRSLCNALNVTSTYGWGVGQNMGPDVESVPHHIYEDWPTASACGQATWSPHMKTNNEPRNSSDDHPQDLKTILDNWENLMATGMRLCSPSSWDGSDYWNATGFLREFFDSIDARGWRCDIIDLHGYWLKSNFETNIPNWYNAIKRPVWVSEWVWGASWNNNGSFVNGVTEAQVASNVKDICTYLNAQPYVERYYYWNSERNPSRLYRDGRLTPTGEYYATIDAGVGYNGSVDYIPAAPRMTAPAVSFSYAANTGMAALTWNEQYGADLTVSMTLEKRDNGSEAWHTLSTFTVKDNPASYSYRDNTSGMGCQYRLHVVDYNGNDLYSPVATVKTDVVAYLYNVGSRQWLTAGNDYGTKASLTANGGLDVTLSTTGDGQYTVDTGIERDGVNHYLNIDGTAAWVDQKMGEWTFVESGSADGKPAYLICKDGSYLAYDGAASALVLNAETDDNARWVIQTRAERLAELGKATPHAPVDATFLLQGPDFHIYDTRNDAWKGSPTLGGRADNRCAEAYNKTFDIYQIITGQLPVGRYRLSVQGYYRQGGYADAAMRHNNGTEQLLAMVYADAAMLPLQSIFVEAGKLSTAGITTSVISGKFPDSMADASAYFSAGLYQNNMQFVLRGAATTRIGIRKTQSVGSDWAIFDNFRLLYLGGFSTAMVATTAAAGRYWATFYSSMADYELPTGATAYTATVSGSQLELHALGSVVPHGCAVVIVSSEAGPLTLNSTTAGAASASLIAANQLKGTDNDARAASLGASLYVMAFSDGQPLFTPNTALALPAEHAYLEGNGLAVNQLSVVFDNASGVSTVRAGHSQSHALYSLQGQRIAQPRCDGIYVSLGKKIVGR